MAGKLSLLLVATAVLAAGAGCQSHPVVENIPSPNFNGPVIVPPVAGGTAPARAWIPPRAPAAAVAGERAWKPTAPPRAWKWIIVHHSATPSGSAAMFDKMHRAKGWDELGYHFVIGNGTESGNGQIEVGPRWPKQKWGAHAKTADNRFNDYGIGICLVGNFDIERPTPQQLQSLAKLIAYLERTYRIPPDRVLGHRDTKPTDCPGRNLNIAVVRRMASQVLADAGEQPVDDGGGQTASATELMREPNPAASAAR